MNSAHSEDLEHPEEFYNRPDEFGGYMLPSASHGWAVLDVIYKHLPEVELTNEECRYVVWVYDSTRYHDMEAPTSRIDDLLEEFSGPIGQALQGNPR